MARIACIDITTTQAEAVTEWLYEVDIELGWLVDFGKPKAQQRVRWHSHLAVLMHCAAQGMTPKQAAEAIAELAIR